MDEMELDRSLPVPEEAEPRIVPEAEEARSAPVEEPREEPEEIPAEAPRKRKRFKKWLKKLGKGAAVVILAAVVAAGSSGLTSFVVSQYWQNQLSLLDRSHREQMEAVQQELKDTLESYRPDLTAAPQQGLTPGQVYQNNAAAVAAVMNYQRIEGVLQPAGTGTGFFITTDGFLVTNYHVIADAETLSVITGDDREYPAQVVGFDSSNDVAVLKVSAQSLPCVKLGSSDALQVGDQVVAVGNALGQFTSTMTVGYISAKDRLVTTDGQAINMIQTDAAINSGNSGGPLFDMNGEVVGITTAKYSGYTESGASIEGIGFAIPMDDVINQISDLCQYGYITGAYMAVVVMEMDTSVAEAYGLPAGLKIAEVVPGGAADRAGIRTGDILINVGGTDVSSIVMLSRALRDYKAGDTAIVTVYREGKLVRMELIFDEKPREQSGDASLPEGDFQEWYDYFSDYFQKENP